jgi:hypothetical protein
MDDLYTIVMSDDEKARRIDELLKDSISPRHILQIRLENEICECNRRIREVQKSIRESFIYSWKPSFDDIMSPNYVAEQLHEWRMMKAEAAKEERDWGY